MSIHNKQLPVLFGIILFILLSCKTSHKAQTSALPEVHEYSSLHGKTNLKGTPIMHFVQREYDLGMVKKGEKRSLTYSFENKGDTALSISLITACECTSTNFEDLRGRIFKPGEKGEIKAVFDSSEKDYGELIDIEIILDQTEPGSDDIPIFEKLYYKFDIQK